MEEKTEVFSWHRRLIEYGWFKILRPRARDLIHYCVAHSFKDCVPIDTKRVKRDMGFNKTALIDAINELEAYRILVRPSQKAIDGVNELLRKKNIETGDILLRLLVPPKLSREQLWLLNDAKTRDAILAIMGGNGVSPKMQKAIEQRMEAIEKSPMESDTLWAGVYERLLVIIKKVKKEANTEVSFEKLLTFLLPQDENEKEMLRRYLYPESAERASNAHWKELNKYERDVALFYEKYTGNQLKVDEVELVKECVRLCYPAQLKWAIQRYAEHLRDFSYLLTLARKGACGRRSDESRKGGATRERAVGKTFQPIDWEERRRQYLRQQASNDSR